MSKSNTIILNTLSYFKHSFVINSQHEPKRKNRFIVEFPHCFRIESYVVQKISKPKINFINNDFVWENIEMELIDIISPSTTAGLYNMIEHCKENSEQETLFSFFLSDLDPTGTCVQNWIIDVKELVSVDFGERNYDNGSVQICKIILKPQRCRIQH